VEMVAAKSGLGSMLWLSWQLFRIDMLYATLVLIAIIGICLTALIRWLGERSAPWLTPSRETT
jgi:ABC-type nitrate/sulfonate/bicarbonate transport system permease component